MGELFALTHRATPGGHRAAQVIACHRCPAEKVVFAHNGRFPEHTLIARFEKCGWGVSRDGAHLCPDCRTKEIAARRAGRTPSPEEKPMAAAPAPSASPSASGAIVELYMLLDDKYHRARKGYVAGYSDERIAKELGLSVTVVAERREKDFGPVVVDTTLEDLAKAKAALVEGLAEVRKAATNLAGLAGHAERRLGDMDKLVARLTATEPVKG